MTASDRAQPGSGNISASNPSVPFFSPGRSEPRRISHSHPYDIANPDPAGTISSLGSLGYTVEAAVADLVDNSIAAEARRIEVFFAWRGPDSWVAVIDDGFGMTGDELARAMTVAARGPAAARTSRDLGRFGMGLKSASFSQAAQLTVGSTPVNNRLTIRTWDLDMVATTGEWRLLHGADDESLALIDRLHPGRTGTVVLWRHLHRYADIGVADDTTAENQFHAEVGRVEAHLGMVFARFLSGRNRVELRVNNSPVKPWDPFLTGHPSVQRLAAEVVPLATHTVRIEGFILPHPRKLNPDEQDAAAGPSGWLDQQGFYVYRRDRLILAGDWLGIRGFRREERYNLARIVVDVPAEADSEWAIDVRKSSAVPPVAIRRHLKRLGTAARRRAAEVIRHRGRIAARTHAAEFTYAWRLDRHDGRIRVRINRDHPLVRSVLSGGGSDDVRDIRALIRLLEETVPVAALRIMHDSDTADDPEPFLGVAPQEAIDVAERIYSAFVAQGRTPREAKERLRLMPPFDELDGFWHASQ